MITLTREEAQQVLDALIYTQTAGIKLANVSDAIETLHARLAQHEPEKTMDALSELINLRIEVETLRARLSAPELEPVAWRKKWEGETKWEYYEFDRYQGSEPLYAIQPQREWQGLTDEEVSDLEQHYLFGGIEFGDDIGYWAVYRAIEAKLREKNT